MNARAMWTASETVTYQLKSTSLTFGKGTYKARYMRMLSITHSLIGSESARARFEWACKFESKAT